VGEVPTSVESKTGYPAQTESSLIVVRQGTGRSLTAAYVAAFLTVCVLAVGFLGFASYRFAYPDRLIEPDPLVTPFWGPSSINSYFARLILMYDSAAQRFALRLDVLALAAFLLFAPYLRRLLPLFRQVPWQLLVKGLVVCTSVAIYIFCARRGGGYPPSIRWGVLTGLAGAVIVATLAAYTRHRFRNRLALIALSALVLAAVVPGFFGTPDLTGFDDFELIFTEHHFSLVLGQAERLAAGHPLGEMVTPQYGLLLHFLLAVFQRHISALSMGGIIGVLELIQLVYLLLCVKIFARHSRGNLLLCLLGIVLVVPWYDFLSNALLGPNQSAWRTLAFPITLVLIPVLHRRSLGSSSFLAGLVAGWFLLLNTEAGIAATGGLCAYLLFRTQFFGSNRRFQNFSQLAPFLPGVLTSVLSFLAAWRLFLGYWPDPSIAKTAIMKLAFWSSSSFGGLRYLGDMTPVVLLAGSIFILIYVALCGIRRPSVPNGVRVAAAAMTMVWLAYYANRPAFWNLSGFAVFFGLMAIDATRGLAIGLERRRFLSFATLSCLMITGIVTVPFLGDTFRFNVNNPDFHWSWRWKDSGNAASVKSAKLSGIFLKEEFAQRIQEKAEGLKRIHRKEPLIFLTMHSYLIPKVSGLSSQLPAGDLMGESQRRLDYDRLLNL
jgi:hypothetical protein